jgi:hypothetical protein
MDSFNTETSRRVWYMISTLGQYYGVKSEAFIEKKYNKIIKLDS